MTDYLTVSAVVFRDDAGRFLTVRKRGTSRFMLPGGKPEVGESPAATAVREIAEEIGTAIVESELELVGEFDEPAANEAGTRLHATVFAHPGRPDGPPLAEIQDLEWIEPSAMSGRDDLAPLLRAVVARLAG
ncbi:NUDIX hydrolase [Millisia brevis]|uniref:NUDIX hydrolase n=1 Tax=Millisia brevis TaxID=264148 RepID=UPI000AE631EE|nr:NUDIX domain-containing protein [Millisia brevis]